MVLLKRFPLLLIIPMHFLSCAGLLLASTAMGPSADIIALSPRQSDTAVESMQKVQACFKRHPDWLLLLPRTTSYVRRSIEKRLAAVTLLPASTRKAIVAFLTRYPALTIEGIQALQRALPPKDPAFPKALHRFWLTHCLTVADQATAWERWHTYLPVKDHLLRLEGLIAHAHLPIAQDLIRLLKLPATHPLSVAARLLRRNAHKNDLLVEADYQALTAVNPYRCLLTISYIRFLLRALRPGDARKVWLSQAHLLNTPPNPPLKALFSRGSPPLNSAELPLVIALDLQQQGNTFRTQGNLAKAQKCYQEALHLLGKDIPHPKGPRWYDKNMAAGLLYLNGLQQPEKALKCFLSILKPKDLYPMAVCSTLPVSNAQQYEAKASYFAAYCCERLVPLSKGTSRQLREKGRRFYYERAARYPFFFYGQLAHFKLKRPLKIIFARPSKTYKPSSARLKTALAVFQGLIQDYRARFPKTLTPPWFCALTNDLAALVKTPADKSHFLGLLRKFEPTFVGAYARQFAKHHESTFAEAYPRIPLPVPVPDPALIYSIILSESAFNPNVISPANAYGLMQLRANAAEDEAKHLKIPFEVKKLSDPEYNMRLGIPGIMRRLQHFKNYYIPAIASYNCGNVPVRRWLQDITPGLPPFDQAVLWIESIPYHETRRYVYKVLSARNTYRCLLKLPQEPQLITIPEAAER